MNFKLLLTILLYITSIFSFENTVNEDILFNDTSSVIDINKLADTSIRDPSEKKGTNIGGSIIAASIISANREFVKKPKLYNTFLNNLLIGSLELDSRLFNQTKVYGNLEADLNPSIDSTAKYEVFLRELFFDFNFNKQVYFRVGKQVLEWGRCYFWNPTDLINIERKTFLEKIGFREGVLGTKFHIPFGINGNIYGFLDLQKAMRLDSIALSLKAEYLIKGSEMALSFWTRRGKPLVFGYDVSTRILGIDVTGELTVANGNIMPKIATNDSIIYLEQTQKNLIPKVSIGIRRDFDLMGFHNAITVELEGFYNGEGYKENVFIDSTKYYSNEFINGSVIQILFTKSEYLLFKGLYDANYHSKYYAAIFLGVNRFIVSDLTFNLNGIMNIYQKCGIISLTLGYTTIGNVYLGATLISNIGPDKTEYTFLNQSIGLRLVANVRF